MSKKEAPTLEVHLGNDWYSGARLLRKVDNPHILPETALASLPSSAKIKKDDKLVKVDDVRSVAEAPAEKKSDLKL